MALECDLFRFVGDEQLNVERRIVTGEEIGESLDEDVSLDGASESVLKGSGVNTRMSMMSSAMPFTSSRSHGIRSEVTSGDGISSWSKVNVGALMVSIIASFTGDSRTFTDSSPIDP